LQRLPDRGPQTAAEAPPGTNTANTAPAASTGEPGASPSILGDLPEGVEVEVSPEVLAEGQTFAGLAELATPGGPRGRFTLAVDDGANEVHEAGDLAEAVQAAVDAGATRVEVVRVEPVNDADQLDEADRLDAARAGDPAA
jgi:hypothetical protein